VEEKIMDEHVTCWTGRKRHVIWSKIEIYAVSQWERECVREERKKASMLSVLGTNKNCVWSPKLSHTDPRKGPMLKPARAKYIIQDETVTTKRLKRWDSGKGGAKKNLKRGYRTL
jgi:hypothetical protein